MVLLFAITVQIRAQAQTEETSRLGNSAGVATRSPKLEPMKPLLNFEPVGGMTYSNFTGGTGAYKFEGRTGYQGGVGFLIGRGRFQFETGLLYSERGGKEIFQSGMSHWEIDYNNRYIEVPTLMRFSYEVSRDAKIFIKGGAVVAVLQDSTGPVTNTQNYAAMNNYYGMFYNSAGTAVNDGDTKSYFSSTDVRGAVGIGGSVKITKSIYWTMQMDYQASLTKVSELQPDGYLGTTSMNLFAVTYGLNTGITLSL